MVSSTALLVVLLAHLFALSAARDLWLPSLPRCWQSCFANTGDGCSSSSCVCETSADSVSYLRRAVSCAVSRCDADHAALDLALGSLDLLCAGIDSRIPTDVMDDAYAAAADADDRDSKSTRTSASTTTRRQRTSTASDPTAEATFTTTTPTPSGQATSAEAPVSAPPRPTAEASLPSLMLLPTSTLAAGSQRTGNSAAGGSGSPFDAPGGASHSRAPGALRILGALAMLYLRL